MRNQIRRWFSQDCQLNPIYALQSYILHVWECWVKDKESRCWCHAGDHQPPRMEPSIENTNTPPVFVLCSYKVDTGVQTRLWFMQDTRAGHSVISTLSQRILSHFYPSPFGPLGLWLCPLFMTNNCTKITVTTGASEDFHKDSTTVVCIYLLKFLIV